MIKNEQNLMVSSVGKNAKKLGLLFTADGLAIAGGLEIWKYLSEAKDTLRKETLNLSKYITRSIP